MTTPHTRRYLAGLTVLSIVLASMGAGCRQNGGTSMRQAVLTENAPKPIGPYSQAIVENGFIFVAGQGPTNPATGKAEIGDVRAETRQTFANMKAILEAAGATMNDVVKCNVYLKDINEFAAMNEVYSTMFQAPFPARTTIQAAALPGGISVEIECIARKPK
jgi:2-iminobutanoate/2-iminopropanoate deaminase